MAEKKEVINAIQISELAGVKANRNYASNRLSKDPTFPRPIIEQVGVGESWWFRKDIVQWLAKDAAKPKTPSGRHAAKLHVQRNSIDLTLALQFICAKQILPFYLRRSRHARLVISQSYSNGEQLC
ncbi:MAG: hypothetical protein K9L79_01480 [Methylobacter tundripaludum]|nr:hypothetical protein [Methylobacter tundripaludum]